MVLINDIFVGPDLQNHVRMSGLRWGYTTSNVQVHQNITFIITEHLLTILFNTSNQFMPVMGNAA